MGCRTHCRQLLEKAVDDAAREVENARAEIAENKIKAAAALGVAKATIATMKAPSRRHRLPTSQAPNPGLWIYRVQF